MQLLNKIAHPGQRGAPRVEGPTRETSLRAIRLRVTAFFALDGFLFASWAVRVPAVKAQVGASPATLGLALLGLSVGSIATMTISGALCRRLGSRNVTVAAAAVLSLTLVLPTFARSAVQLGLALAVFGVAYGALNVAMNSVAVDVVAALRRPVMPAFHAAWSFGGLAGASAGGLLAPHLAPRPGLALIAAAGLAVTAVAGRGMFPPTPEAGSAAVAPVTTSGVPRAWRVVALFGLIALCSAYGEGAIADWGALHLKEDLGTGAGLAAAGYAAFAVAEACGRLAGTGLLARFGQTRVLAAGGITAATGMLAAALAPDLPVALAGFAATGLGVANLFPAAMAQAGLAAGPRGVAAASTLGYAGFLLGPPAIGLLATGVSLRAGLTTISALTLLAALLAVVAGNVTGASGPGTRL